MFYLIEYTEGVRDGIDDIPPQSRGLFQSLEGIVQQVPNWVQDWINAVAPTEIEWNKFDPADLPVVSITRETLESALDTEEGIVFQFKFGWKWAPALKVTIRALEVLDAGDEE